MSSAGWWAKKLAEQGVAPAPVRPTPPATRPPAPQYPPHQYGQQTVPSPAIPRQARAVKVGSQCPQCGDDDNYFPMPGSQMFKCFACGYPVPEQSGSGPSMPGSGNTGPARAAHGQAAATWQPQNTMAGRIG